MTMYDPKNSRLYAAQYDLTDSIRSISGPGPAPVRDATPIGTGGRKFIRGNVEDVYQFEGFLDSASGKSEDAIATFRAATDGKVLSYYPHGDDIGNGPVLVAQGELSF